jgi:hypothetical protein
MLTKLFIIRSQQPKYNNTTGARKYTSAYETYYLAGRPDESVKKSPKVVARKVFLSEQVFFVKRNVRFLL